MQNRYVGDIGDFAKYALLRSIMRCSPHALRLAVIWYLYPDEDHNSDGRHIGYLNSQSYRDLEPDLHRAMSRLVRKGQRRIAEIRKSGVLPPSTQFFEEGIAEMMQGGSVRQRLASRMEWFSRAQAAVVGADVVFLDPDNGIEVRSVSKGAIKGGKYVYWDEIQSLWLNGHSLLIYHHLNRTMKATLQTKVLLECFVKKLGQPALLVPLLFRRGSCRHFWIVGQPAHAPVLQFGLEEILKSRWSNHFERAR
jgi:hypothetical protein